MNEPDPTSPMSGTVSAYDRSRLVCERNAHEIRTIEEFVFNAGWASELGEYFIETGASPRTVLQALMTAMVTLQ